MRIAAAARSAAIALVTACAMCLPAGAQTWPDKPIKLVVNFPPGGVADTLARGIGPSLSEALKGDKDDPVAGPIMEFRIVDSVKSVDDPKVTHTSASVKRDKITVPGVLTAQIPLVAPVRERVVEFGRSGPGDSGGAARVAPRSRYFRHERP